MNTQSMNDNSKFPGNPNKIKALYDTDRSILRKTGYRQKNEYGVTDLQEQFARLVAETGTLTEAYIRVYYLGQGKEVTGKPETIHRAAYGVSCKKNVAERIKHYQQIKIDQANQILQARLDQEIAIAKANDLTNEQIRAFIREKLYTMARSDTIQANAQLKAIELLGKLAGISAFEKIAANEQDRTEAEAKAKLKELIEHLRAQGKLAKPVVVEQVSSVSLLDPPKPLKDNET